MISSRWHPATERTAVIEDESIQHLQPPEYHGDPTSDDGALVFTRWGFDAAEITDSAAAFSTRVHIPEDRRAGLSGELSAVLVSEKQ